MKSNWNKYRSLNIKIGLILSLGLMLVAFEWKTYEPVTLVILSGEIPEEDPWILPPVTETPPPPKPKPVLAPVFEEVDNEEIVDELPEMVMTIEPTDEIPEVTPIDEGEEEEVVKEPEFYLAPEVHAAPEDGMRAFLKYIGKEVKYPRQAKRMGVQGKVILQFIVDAKGNITNIKVLRGIGAGCDEEAVRVLENAPQWTPARQRGREVKQKMTFPIHFRLG